MNTTYTPEELKSLIGMRARNGNHTFTIVSAVNTKSYGAIVAGSGCHGIRLHDIELLPALPADDSPAKTLKQLLTFG
mgnify:CR=1 FL=1